MATREIKMFVDVEIEKASSRVAAAGFNVPMCLTPNALISTSRRNKEFSTYASVSDYFGSTSEEAKAANAFYFQDLFQVEQPDKMQFGRFANVDTSALLEMGTNPETDYTDWLALSDGEFEITIDGTTKDIIDCDFATALVTSLDDVAGVIQARLRTIFTAEPGAALIECYYLDNRFNIQSGTTGDSVSLIALLTTISPAGAGTDISGSAFLDGDVEATPAILDGSILSQGQDLETVEVAITAIEEVRDDWVAMGTLLALRDTDSADAMAVSIASRRKIFIIATNDSNITSGGTSIASKAKDLNNGRAGGIYSATASEYPDWSWYGQQLPKEIGSTNWAYKELAGTDDGAAVNITVDTLNQTQRNAALDVNCNLYTSTLGAVYTYFGTMFGGKNAEKEGEFIDIVRNIDFLQTRIEEGLLNLFLETDIIYMTNAGISMFESRLQGLLETYGVQQGILVEGSIVVSFPKRSDISSTDRDDRLLPDGTFTAQLTGGINKVIIRGTVSI